MDKMRNSRILTASAMLLAIAVILGFFKIPVNQFMELRFAFLPIACTGMLFGPFVGGVVGALSDILGYLVKPTGPYFPGFTVTQILSGVMYGLVLYKKEIEEAEDPAAAREMYKQAYIDEFLNPYRSAELGKYEDVIEPAESRKKIIQTLRMFWGRRKQRAMRKHGNIPL